jgi:hypothetical protein
MDDEPSLSLMDMALVAIGLPWSVLLLLDQLGLLDPLLKAIGV